MATNTLTTHTLTSSRRVALLTPLAALLPLPTAAQADHLDAELIRLCEQHMDLDRQLLATNFNAVPFTPEDEAAEEEQDRIHEAQAVLLDRICELRAQSLAGAVALARMVSSYDHDSQVFANAAPGGYHNERLLGALVGGLIGWPA